MKAQVAAAVSYMREHGPLTRAIAFMSLDIANITAVIADARKAGVDVTTIQKTDPKGRTYASYRLAS